MPVRTRDLMKDWRRNDAEKMARFMNESGKGWPDGGWDPMRSDEAYGHFHDQRALGAFVAEVGGKVVAYCNVAAKPDERNRAYVPFLNAHPDYHGKGFGKAVLLRAIERVYELGIGRVDLDTWPGNLKAVPLYKKSGFMWAPDSRWGVLMQNFTPGARRHPVAQAFFRKHDWYRTMKRDLSLAADDHKRGKVRVYPYEWEEGGDRLRMVYDRESWGLLEIETNDFLVACHLEDEKLTAGLPHRIRWEILNHQPRPLEVALVASADEGIKLDHKRILQVKRRVELSAEFEIDPDMREKEQEPRAPIIRTDLILNGMPVTLAAGFEAEQVVSFELDSLGGFLRPGRPERVVIQAWSDPDRPLTAKVRVRGAAEVKVEPAAATLVIQAKRPAELPITLTASEAGVVPLRVEAEVKTKGRLVRPKSADLYVHVARPGEVIGHVEKERVVLESAALRVQINRREGWVSIGDKLRNLHQAAGLSAPRPGPPFAWSEFFDSPCEARIEREGERAVAVLTTQSVYQPGVWLERRIALSNLPVVEVIDSLVNGSPRRLATRLQRNVHLRGNRISSMTANGVVRDLVTGAGRSPGEHKFTKEPEAWPEPWVAVEDSSGFVTGLMWQPAYRVHGHGSWNELEHELPPAEPGQSATAGPLHVFVGEGDYFTVRRWWQTLAGPRLIREQRRPRTRPSFDFGLRPSPLVLHGKEVQARLVVDSLGTLELAGRVRLAPPAGIRIQPRSIEFRKTSQDHVRGASVAVERSGRLPEGAYPVACSAQFDRMIYREAQSVIVLGDPAAKVTVKRAGKRHELFRVENGRLALTIAPEFQGSAISLERRGEQLLRSAYPEARPLAWENPWYGGISPHLGSLGRELFQEKFVARQIRRRGAQGVVWQGVRLSCTPKNERARHDAMGLDYLLAPGSDILAVAVRTTRRAGTAGWLDAGFQLAPIVGGSHLDAVISSHDDPRASRVRCQFGGWLGSDHWILAENPKAGQAVLLACREGEASLTGGIFGREGYQLQASRRSTLEARETRESVFFICYIETPRARDLAEALSKLDGLP